MSLSIEELEQGVNAGTIEVENAVTELAWRLNANEPESVKMGWPLVTCIEVAIERLNAQGVAVNGIGLAELVRSRFVGEDNETGAILVIEEPALRGGEVAHLFKVYPWPGGAFITAEKAREFLGRRRKGEVLWGSIGSAHPGRAKQYAKALQVAADIAFQEVE